LKKIIRNIIPTIKLYRSLKYLSKFKQNILAARASGDFEKERHYILKSTSVWGKHVVNMFNINLNVEGEENIPQSGPVVFVANHQSFADIPVACALLTNFQFAFVAKRSVEQVPLYGKWIKLIRSVYIDRESARASMRAIDEGIDLINNGFSLLIFPEGERSRCSNMNEFKKGSLRLATKPGVPVVPITIDGAYHVFEEFGYVQQNVPIKVVIHPAIETKDLAKSEANNLSAEVQKIILTGF